MRFRYAKLAAAACIAGVLGCAGPAPGVQAPRGDVGVLASVAWLTGDWEGASPDGSFDEHWGDARAGVMLGVGREVLRDGRLSFFEYMRIEARPDGVFLVPQPRGKPGHDFKLVSLAGEHAVFENAGDDRVHRIEYARHGDELEARVQGDGIDDRFRLKLAARLR